MAFKQKLLIIVVTIISMSCHKRCIPRQFNLTGGSVNIYPDKDSIQVGDTLWFSCSVPAKLKYFNSNVSDSGIFNISDATNFETDFHLTSPIGVNMQVGAMDSFSFISVKGGLQSNPLDISASKTISYIAQTDKYTVSFGMVAQKKGVYVLIVLDIYQAMIKCDKLSIVVLMNNIDNHLHYLKDIYFGGQPIYTFDSTHSYCFKVY